MSDVMANLKSLGLLVCLLGLGADAPGRAAEIGVWEPVGPPSGRVDRFTVDPTDADRLYAGQDEELLRSVDGGRSWHATRHVETERFVALEVAPSEPAIVYAITLEGAVLRSQDGGESWTERAPLPGDDPRPGPLAVDPTDADHLVTNATIHGELAVSTDGAASWTTAALGASSSFPIVAGIAFDPDQVPTVYAATSGEYFRSPDGGATWTPTAAAPSVVTDLIAHPSRSGVLYAASRRGVETSTDGGETWSRLGGPAGPARADEVAVAPGDPATIFAVAFEGLWRSDDDGATWSVVNPTRGHLELAPAEPGTLYLGTTAGIAASLNGGGSLELRTPPGPPVAVQDLLATVQGPRRLLASADGLFRSDDQAATWSFLPVGGFGPAGFGPLGDPAGPLASGGSPNRRIVASTAAGLLASDDHGTTWREITSPAVGLPPALLAVDGVRRDTLYAWGEAGVSRSRDGGESWTQAAPIGNDCFSALVPHPTREEVLFGTADCCLISETGDCGGVFASFDGWSTRETLRERPGRDLAIRPPGTLFLTDSGGVYRSADLGATWQLVTGEPRRYSAGKLLIDPADPGVVFASVNASASEEPPVRLIVSEDGGDTWTRLDAGLPSDAVITDLAIDPRRPELVYAGTAGHGAWRLQRRELSEPPPPPDGPWLESGELSGFRVKVRISAPGGFEPPVQKEAACIPETLCVSGAVPGRSEVFVRIVGPKPNGFLWPTLVKFSTSTIEVWIEQTTSSVLRYYRLEGAAPGEDVLPGLFDRTGFLP
jgi:photosystem II stability/assembly factor-like uncharacterized protein